jgi:N-methylhydantoinase B
MLNSIELNYPDGTCVVPRNKDLILGVPKGTLYRQIAGGGGGYGDPKQRDRKKVAEEVRNGVISPQAARDIYGFDGEDK